MTVKSRHNGQVKITVDGAAETRRIMSYLASRHTTFIVRWLSDKQWQIQMPDFMLSFDGFPSRFKFTVEK